MTKPLLLIKSAIELPIVDDPTRKAIPCSPAGRLPKSVAPRVADAGVDGRHGRIINQGTWMIGGPSFDASVIGRHDTTYDPTKDLERGHGLRLASDQTL